MPNNPNTWLDIIANLSIETKGVVIAVIISAMRVIYDKEETRPVRIVLESLICGALSYTASYGIEAAGMDSHWSVFAGGMIGYIGSTTVKGFAVKFLSKKIEEKK